MEIGKTYKITFETTSGKTLTFTGKITDLNDKFVTFIDRFGKKLHYNIKLIVSYEEVEE